MGRLNGLSGTDNGTVSGVTYGPANELLGISYYGANETRTYNNLLQLTHITITYGQSGINQAYNYPTGTNNAKISSMTDALSGETVTYQYDSLNRLISAAGNGWSQGMTYDGFGNLTARTGAQPMNTPVDPATNRLTGISYDANGNQNPLTYVYDPENRIAYSPVGGGSVEYFYDAQNKRIWQGTCSLGGTASKAW